VGCEQTMKMLHVYAELVASSEPAEERYPRHAAHLRACGPCGGDFEGLLAAICSEAPWPRPSLPGRGSRASSIRSHLTAGLPPPSLSR
jgi:hypothetical protein